MPTKTATQLFNRKKNRCAANAPDNVIKVSRSSASACTCCRPALHGEPPCFLLRRKLRLGAAEAVGLARPLSPGRSPRSSPGAAPVCLGRIS